MFNPGILHTAKLFFMGATSSMLLNYYDQSHKGYFLILSIAIFILAMLPACIDGDLP